jgi:hypothetical protein
MIGLRRVGLPFAFAARGFAGLLVIRAAFFMAAVYAVAAARRGCPIGSGRTLARHA